MFLLRTRAVPLRPWCVPGLLSILLLGSAACAARPAPPTPENTNTAPPHLGGRAVFVLPVQTSAGGEAIAGLDAELAFFLAERVPAVRWVFAPAVVKAAANAPTLRLRPSELDVAAFQRLKLERIGDPLFGDLHALGSLLEARYALLPYAARFVPDAAGSSRGRVEIGLALLDTSDGDVLWMGAVAGEAGEAGSPGLVASAAAAVARQLAR